MKRYVVEVSDSDGWKRVWEAELRQYALDRERSKVARDALAAYKRCKDDGARDIRIVAGDNVIVWGRNPRRETP